MQNQLTKEKKLEKRAIVHSTNLMIYPSTTKGCVELVGEVRLTCVLQSLVLAKTHIGENTHWRSFLIFDCSGSVQGCYFSGGLVSAIVQGCSDKP